MTHAEIGSIHRACKHASMSFKANQSVELYVVLMPRHMQVCICCWIAMDCMSWYMYSIYMPIYIYIYVDGRDNV